MGKLLERFNGLIGRETFDALRRLSADCAGMSVLHVHSGRLRWDVLNMLDRLSELFDDLGLNFRAATMVGTEELCDVVALSEDDTAQPSAQGLGLFYDAALRASAQKMFLSSDLVVVHGLQPIGLVKYRRDESPWVWRCHSNVRQARPAFWALSGGYVNRYQAAAFSHPSFIPDLSVPRFVIPPSVDPFSPANRDFSTSEIGEVLDSFGIPQKHPLALSYLNLGSVKEALDAVRLWKAAHVPKDAVLVLLHVGEQHPNSAFLGEVDRHVLRAVDSQVHFLRLGRAAGRELGALGWAARVVLDPSTSPWPNLALLDAMWKGRPVIARAGSANAAIIQDGGRACAQSDEELGRRLREFLEDPGAARSAGAVARRWVVQRHLATRHILDYLKMLQQFKEGKSARETDLP